MWVKGVKSHLFPYLILFLLALKFMPISGQENLLLYTTKVTINAQNVPLIEILDLMERNHAIDFSYKEGLFDKNERKTFVVKNLPLYDALDSLFQSDSLSYYPLGRNVVIYKPTNIVPRNIVVRDTLVQNVLRKDTVQVKVLQRDTLIVFKTDTLYDTIYVKDPYPVYDTLFMDKPKMQLSAFYNYNVYSFNRETSGAGMAYNDSLFKSGAGNPYTSRLGLLALVNLNENFYFKAGFGLSKTSWSGNYDFSTVFTDSTNIVNYNITTETEVYKNDSIFIYFPGSDTLWFYEYDTIFTYYANPEYKKDTVRQTYSGKSELMYFTIPLYFGWETDVFEDSKFFGEIGVLMDFLISSDGHALSDSPLGELLPLSDLPFSPVSSYFSIGMGLESPFVRQTTWFVKLNYDWQISSDFARAYRIKQRKNGIGLTVGLKF